MKMKEYSETVRARMVAAVEGVPYEIDAADLVALDRFEGHPRSCQRTLLAVSVEVCEISEPMCTRNWLKTAPPTVAGGPRGASCGTGSTRRRWLRRRTPDRRPATTVARSCSCTEPCCWRGEAQSAAQRPLGRSGEHGAVLHAVRSRGVSRDHRAGQITRRGGSLRRRDWRDYRGRVLPGERPR